MPYCCPYHDVHLLLQAPVGFILKDAMREFTFDDRETAPIAAVAEFSMAGVCRSLLLLLLLLLLPLSSRLCEKLIMKILPAYFYGPDDLLPPGQKPPKEPAFEAPRQQGWSPFGAFVKEGAVKPSRDEKENQDGTMIKPYLYDGVSAFCVFDGHGENGMVARPRLMRHVCS